MRDFGRWEFQLMLLRRMSDLQPARVRAALAELGATRAEHLAAHERWQRMVRSPRRPGPRAVLGPPDSTLIREVRGGPVEVRSWALPGLWPELCWQVLAAPGGPAVDGTLARRSATPLPVPADPEPWSLVVGDAVADPALRLVNTVPDDTPSRTVLVVERADGRRQTLIFVWGLLQQTR